MADRTPRPGDTEHRHGVADATKEALSEQVYEELYKPLLDQLLGWAREHEPLLYYQFCSLWQNHARVMRNEVILFTQTVEAVAHFIPMPDWFRNVGERGLGHLPVATQRYMLMYLPTVQYPPDFQRPSALASFRVNWRMLLQGNVLDQHWPILERLRAALNRETLERAKDVAAFTVVGLGRTVDVLRKGYLEAKKDKAEESRNWFLRLVHWL